MQRQGLQPQNPQNQLQMISSIRTMRQPMLQAIRLTMIRMQTLLSRLLSQAMQVRRMKNGRRMIKHRAWRVLLWQRPLPLPSQIHLRHRLHLHPHLHRRLHRRLQLLPHRQLLPPQRSSLLPRRLQFLPQFLPQVLPVIPRILPVIPRILRAAFSTI